MLSPDDKEKYFIKNKRDHITLRTVQRAVKTLSGLGIVFKKGKQYSFSPDASKEMRYFSEDFATPAISSITSFPLKTIEQSLEDLIIRYGAFIIFVFIEATRPIISVNPSDSLEKKSCSTHGCRMLFQ